MKPILVANHAIRPVPRPPRPLRARPPAARAAAVLTATVALVLLAAACSGSPSPTVSGGSSSASGSANASGSPSASGSTDSPSAVAYSHCMRSHGVPDYPDPSNGVIPKGDAQHFGVSDSQFRAAQNACQHLLPTGGSFEQQARQCLNTGDCPPTLVQQMLTADRKFAQCMRSHGVPNWPDPTIGGNGGPSFYLDPVGITHSQTHSPPMSTKIAECERLDPAPVALR